ncbi:HxlR family transcriptional regulator [Saccharothrix sp. NRRL B-16348]|uniref:winged helix-turn-helix transcriptional regulator n=1 Tax=Saccharothrix sp. NRRL B-16348 TaxID=1415542 RepID=UPI0006AF560F|nr:helix-turn-helix domain-containing protein [Saccharothrix sp. NRRL B-16348]KOX33990.1 HxlR family transcriptional regulator [Saccharothrix sp. NRRL B-16348]
MVVRGDVYDRNCPTRVIANHATGQWGSLVLGKLLDDGGGTKRFSELRREVSGISEKMLAQTLQALERDGLVHREVHPVIPPRVDYSLTALGTHAAKQISELFGWIEENLPSFMAAQDEYDARRAEKV